MREKLIEIIECYADFLDWDTKEDMVDSIMEKCFATDNNVGSKWIPVSERLPERKERIYEDAAEPSGYGMYLESCEVLGYTTKGEVCICKMCDDLWDTYDVYDDVTHWMPLPEPPKGE